MQGALALLEEALEVDPNFCPVLVQLAQVRRSIFHITIRSCSVGSQHYVQVRFTTGSHQVGPSWRLRTSALYNKAAVCLGANLSQDQTSKCRLALYWLHFVWWCGSKTGALLLAHQSHRIDFWCTVSTSGLLHCLCVVMQTC